MLPAGPGRPVRVYSEIALVDLDLDVVGEERRHDDLGERRVPPVRGVERRAHEAVDAALGLQDAVRVLAADGDGGRLEACFSPALASKDLRLEPRSAAQRRYMRSSISAQSCASVPPVTCMDLEDGVAPVVLAREERFLLEPGEIGLDGHELLRDLALQLGVEPVQLLRVLELALQALVALELASGARVLGRDACRRRLIAPEVGRAHRLLELRAAPRQAVGVRQSRTQASWAPISSRR